MDKQTILKKQKTYHWPSYLLYYTEPLALDHGEGLYVWDVGDNRYLDFLGGTPVSTAASLATIEVMDEEAPPEYVAKMGDMLRSGGAIADHIAEMLDILDYALADVQEKY